MSHGHPWLLNYFSEFVNIKYCFIVPLTLALLYIISLTLGTTPFPYCPLELGDSWLSYTNMKSIYYTHTTGFLEGWRDKWEIYGLTIGTILNMWHLVLKGFWPFVAGHFSLVTLSWVLLLQLHHWNFPPFFSSLFIISVFSFLYKTKI